MSVILSSNNIKGHVIRLNKDEDIIEQIKEIARKMNIKAGFFFGIGSFEELHIAFYDQKKKKYEENIFTEELEMTSIIGNISTDGNDVLVHCHVNAGDKNSIIIGGHVLPGSKVFAGELFLIEISNEELTRVYDDITGLKLLSKRVS
ncbi:MAG: PPC domain-containing DNA-binding protein [Thermoprotei archaeon]|jgi:predicted DNA-binding protein with PD1-like motif